MTAAVRGNTRPAEQAPVSQLLVNTAMADFDAIYEDQQDEVASILESPQVNLVPDPIIIRGAGNITV